MPPAWDYAPAKQEIQREPPPTLITRLEDGKEIIRQKHSFSPRVFIETHHAVEATHKLMLDFLDTKGLSTTFDKYTYDSQDTSPAATTVSVRFFDYPTTKQGVGNVVHSVWKFIETNEA